MSDKMVVAVVDYTKYLGARYASQGDGSAEIFRKRIVAALNISDNVEVDLDGTVGCGLSFIEEVFGGLVRTEGMDKEEILKKISVKSIECPYYIQEALQAIKQAVTNI